MSEVQGVNSVDIAITVLESVMALGGNARASDIAKHSGLSKSRLHKYLVSLCRNQMLYQEQENSRYSLGSKLLTLATAAGKQQTLAAIINNALCELRDELNYSTGWAVRQGNGVLLTHYNRSHKNIDIDYLENTPAPMNASAAGYAYQAFDPSVTPVLEAEDLEKIRQQGYAVRYNPTEGIPGARAIACPIYSKDRTLLGMAITMGFIPDDETEIVRLANRLMEKVKTIPL
ncbi:IclR family transcriptional regulator [Serratia fonticola]|uniref:IclR family transcriptional regulator n=1 Tax=Serratia fonticola TaxID=47917 RepID=A0A559TA74_SERFO|nr:helix-turn-helix domain-containing protein [Serratia fonticola]TQI81001.1 IclR family transcriptional regulator [Serratia fonticola]TQI96975.1 IclR family transcriptional regulator [Serratia fonticola]TVZ71470.1 IclR family transcriptional regulator [Serratia fonticola]